MPEYSGSLPPLELTQALWSVPLLALAAAIGCALWRSRQARVAHVAIGGSAAALGVLLWKVVELFTGTPLTRSLIDTPWTLLRIGSLDVSFGFALDASGAAVGLGACVAALVVCFVLARRDPVPRRELACTCLALGATLLVALGDNLFVMAIGWAGLALAAYLLAGDDFEARDDREAAATFSVQHLALFALLSAAGLLLWGLGGTWAGDGGFVPDFHARLVAVAATDAAPSDARNAEPMREGRGTLSFSALPGSTLKLGGADLCLVDGGGQPGGLGTPSRPCRQIARSPFVGLRAPASIHDVRVVTAPGTHDLWIEKLRISRGAETRIELTGPTLTFREIENQLSIRDASGVVPLRARFTQKKLFGVPLPALISALVLLAAFLRVGSGRVLGALGARPAGAALIASLGLGAAVLLVMRLQMLFGLAPRLTSVLCAGFALFALYTAARATQQSTTRAAIVLAVAAESSLAIAGAALGARGAGGVHVAVLATSAVALMLAQSPSDRAYRFGAAAAAAAPVPVLGLFFARDAAFWSAFTSEHLLVPGWSILLVGALASALVSYALWARRGAEARSAGSHRALEIGGAVALALGLLLIPLGDPAAHAPGEWLFGAPLSDAPVDPTLRYGVLALGFTLTLGAFFAAHRRALPASPWLAAASRARVSNALLTGLERVGQRLVALDRAIEKPFGPEASDADEHELLQPSERAPRPAPSPVASKKKTKKARKGGGR